MAIEQKKGSKSDTPQGGAGDTAAERPAYLSEMITELKKTTWPSKQEANRLTSVVIGVIVVVAVYMGLMDVFLSFVVNKFSLIK